MFLLEMVSQRAKIVSLILWTGIIGESLIDVKGFLWEFWNSFFSVYFCYILVFIYMLIFYLPQ